MSEMSQNEKNSQKMCNLAKIGELIENGKIIKPLYFLNVNI